MPCPYVGVLAQIGCSRCSGPCIASTGDPARISLSAHVIWRQHQQCSVVRRRASCSAWSRRGHCACTTPCTLRAGCPAQGGRRRGLTARQRRRRCSWHALRPNRVGVCAPFLLQGSLTCESQTVGSLPMLVKTANCRRMGRKKLECMMTGTFERLSIYFCKHRSI
jgi:hypothetical protein